MKTIKKIFKWMAYFTFGILLLGLVGGLIANMFDDENTSDKQETGVKPMSEVEAAPAAVTEDDKKKDSIRNAEREQLKKERVAKKSDLESKIASLKRNFIIKKDEFRDAEFYTHKVFGKNMPNYKTLTVGLNNTGYIYMRSNYHDDDWIFHNKVTVKIGDGGGMYTEEVPSYSKNNRTDNNGNGVWENVTYEEASHIIEGIATADPSKRILVRFHGRQYYDDVPLGPKTKQAFKESYELSEAIKELRSL